VSIPVQAQQAGEAGGAEAASPRGKFKFNSQRRKLVRPLQGGAIHLHVMVPPCGSDQQG